MWIGLLFNLGIILALLAILYYIETRLQSISAYKGVSLEMFNSVIHRQNDLANRCNKISDFLVDVDKWINNVDDTKSIEIAEDDLIPVSETECSSSESESEYGDNDQSDHCFTDGEDTDSNDYDDKDDEEDEDEDAPYEVLQINKIDEPIPIESEPLESEPLESEQLEFELNDVDDDEDPFKSDDVVKHITVEQSEPEPEPSLHPTETDLIIDDSTTDLRKLSLKELKSIAKQRSLTNFSQLSKSELIAKLNGDITIHI